MTYSGIGSRETPFYICDLMTEIAIHLDNLGYTLNSGGATGSDSAFEKGSKRKQIFLPWNGFENKFIDNVSYFIPEYNETYVRKYHPKFNKLSKKSRLLMSRNTYQVLGKDLKTPVDFVLCYTENALMKGGTSQALRIAKDYHIPVFNFGDRKAIKDFGSYISQTRDLFSLD